MNEQEAPAVAAQPLPSPPQARRPPQRVRSIEDAYNDIKDQLKIWARAAAGYSVLTAAVESRKSADPNVRKRAAPLFHTPPVSFAGEQLELVFDPNKCAENEVEWALIPHANAQVGVIRESLDRLSNLVAELRVMQQLPPIPTATPEAPQQAG